MKRGPKRISSLKWVLVQYLNTIAALFSFQVLHRASAIRASGSSVSVYALLSLPQCVSVCVCVSDRLCESAAAKYGKKTLKRGVATLGHFPKALPGAFGGVRRALGSVMIWRRNWAKALSISCKRAHFVPPRGGVVGALRVILFHLLSKLHHRLSKVMQIICENFKSSDLFLAEI